MRSSGAAILLAGLLLLAGCGSTSEVVVAEGFDPAAPLRVAVLPVVDRSGNDPLLSPSHLDTDPPRKTRPAADLHRSLVARLLANTSWQVVDPRQVDSAIAHRNLEVLAAYGEGRPAAARRLGRALGVDAVLFCELWRGEEGETIEAQVAVHDARGAGLVVAELFAPTVFGITRTVVAGIDPAQPDRPGRKPRARPITFVAHSAQGVLAPGDELVVVAAGRPGGSARFSVGDLPSVAMTETAPGSYRGALVVSRAHTFEGASITVRLKLRGLESAMTVTGPPLWTREAN